MLKDRGARGKGQAKFVWVKQYWIKDYPLGPEQQYKLDELAEIRARLFDGKLRTDLAIDNLVARQNDLIDMLHQDGVDIELKG